MENTTSACILKGQIKSLKALLDLSHSCQFLYRHIALILYRKKCQLNLNLLATWTIF